MKFKTTCIVKPGGCQGPGYEVYRALNTEPGRGDASFPLTVLPAPCTARPAQSNTNKT